MRLPADIVERARSRFEAVPVCVTGGAGFIGGHLVDALLSVGAVVSVIDDLSNSTAEHVGEMLDLVPDRLRFVHGSILDDSALDEALRGGRPGRPGRAAEPAAIVFHLAALGSVARSIEDPQRTWEVNATGTVRVLEAARQCRCRRVVFAASSSAYGGEGGNAGPQSESLPPSPRSPYAASKVAGEAAMLAWARSFGMSTVSLRFFNVFGPRQPADSPYAAVVAALTRRLLAGEPPLIHGDGRQTRDFTYVANAVVGLLLAGSSQRPLAGEVVNIGGGVRTSVLELAGMLAAACTGGAGTVPSEPEFAPERPGDVRHSLADLTRARDLLDYEPVVPLRAGLEETVAWYREVCAGC